MRSWWSIVWLGGCVVSVDQRVTVREPVDEIRVHLQSGDLTVHAAEGPVVVDGVLGGPSRRGPELVVGDGVLTIDAPCALCGGRIDLSAPSDTRLFVVLGAGSVEVTGMSGDLDLDLDVGGATLTDQAGGALVVRVSAGDLDLDASEVGSVDATVGTGDAELALSAGGYAFDLEAGGPVDVDDALLDDPEGPSVRVRVDHGRVTVGTRDGG